MINGPFGRESLPYPYSCRTDPASRTGAGYFAPCSTTVGFGPVWSAIMYIFSDCSDVKVALAIVVFFHHRSRNRLQPHIRALRMAGAVIKWLG